MSKKEESKEQPSNEEIIQNLQTQLKDYKEKAEYYKIMSIKAEGALEVLAQLNLVKVEDSK